MIIKELVMIKKAVILCGGLATRLLPITKSIPKEMMPILSKPAIDYVIDDLKNNGVTDILVILGRNKECLENYYDRNVELEDRLLQSNKTNLLEELKHIYEGVNISFIRQIFTKGTGYAVSLAKNFVGDDPFILSYPDELIIGQSFAKQLIEEYEKTRCSIIPLKQINISDSYKYGMVDYTENESKIKITNIIEKPDPESSPSDICYTGGGIFTKEIFGALENCQEQPNGETYLTDAFFPLINNDNLYGKVIVGERIDFGNPLGFVKGNIIAALNDERYSEDILEFITNIVHDN